MAKLFANSGNLDQMPCSAASELVLHCLLITLFGLSRLQWANPNSDLFLFQSCDTLNRSVLAVDLTSDISSVAKQRGSGPNTPEQMLLDCYVSIR